MKVEEVAPPVDPSTLLAGAQFMDAYRLEMGGAHLDARCAAERMMAQAPRWVDALLMLRNVLVAPFGLKTSGDAPHAPRDIIGIFPVVSETPDRLVAVRVVPLVVVLARGGVGRAGHDRGGIGQFRVGLRG